MRVESISQDLGKLQADTTRMAGDPPDAQSLRAAAGTSRTPEVVRGASVRGGTVSGVGLDWLNMSGPAEAFEEVRRIFRREFGAAEVGVGLRNYYRRWWRFQAGALLLDQPSQVGMPALAVQVPGKAVALLGALGAVGLLVDLTELGFQATRLDDAIDFRGEHVTLLEDLLGACKRDELRQVRSYRPVGPEVVSGREVGFTLYMGSRGNKDSVFVRAYDKGLESGTCGRRQWVRWEAEFHGARARHAQQVIVNAYRIETGKLPAEAFAGTDQPTTWAAALMGLALGVVDFREGKRSQRSCRLKRPAWWSEVIEGVKRIRCRGRPRAAPSVEATVRAVRRQWGGGLAALAEASGMSVGQIAELVFAGCTPSRRARASPLLWEIVRLYKGGEVVAA